MKRILLVLAVALTFIVGCTKEETPEPIAQSIVQKVVPVPTVTPTPIPAQSYNFNGTWDCDNWIVDTGTGMMRKRSFIFSNQTIDIADVSLNQYSSGGVLTQLFTMSSADIDSNYFDNQSNPIQIKFKGVMTTDSTLMVYEYGNNSGGGVDTFQMKEFKRN